VKQLYVTLFTQIFKPLQLLHIYDSGIDYCFSYEAYSSIITTSADSITNEDRIALSFSTLYSCPRNQSVHKLPVEAVGTEHCRKLLLVQKASSSSIYAYSALVVSITVTTVVFSTVAVITHIIEIAVTALV
jgi:hypothetical protein